MVNVDVARRRTIPKKEFHAPWPPPRRAAIPTPAQKRAGGFNIHGRRPHDRHDHDAPPVVLKKGRIRRQRHDPELLSPRDEGRMQAIEYIRFLRTKSPI